MPAEAEPCESRANIVETSLLIEAGVKDKTIMTLMAAVVVGAVGLFFKGAWNDAEEDAKPSYRWFDKNRWE